MRYKLQFTKQSSVCGANCELCFPWKRNYFFLRAQNVLYCLFGVERIHKYWSFKKGMKQWMLKNCPCRLCKQYQIKVHCSYLINVFNTFMLFLRFVFQCFSYFFIACLILIGLCYLLYSCFILVCILCKFFNFR